MKNKSSRRTLPLPEPVLEMLSEEKEKQTLYRKMFKGSYNRKYDDFVCVNELGDLIRPSYVTQHFSDLLKKYGLRHIRFHDLRHTFASILIGQDVPLINVSNFLGHSDLSTTVNIKNPYEQLNESKQLDFVCIMKRANHKQTCLRLALFNNYLEFCCTILSYSEQRVSSRIGFFNSHSQTVSTFQPCEERFSATRLSRAILVLIFSSQNSVFVFGITKYLQFV